MIIFVDFLWKTYFAFSSLSTLLNGHVRSVCSVVAFRQHSRGQKGDLLRKPMI